MNLHTSWLNCKNIEEVADFQRLALIKLREEELLFQRNTESDKIVLMSFELAREILLNVKYDKQGFYCEGLEKLNFNQKCHKQCEICKEKM